VLQWLQRLLGKAIGRFGTSAVDLVLLLLLLSALIMLLLLLSQVTSRAVGLLQPLVLGWTSLASCGLLPKGLNTARAALQVVQDAADASCSLPFDRVVCLMKRLWTPPPPTACVCAWLLDAFSRRLTILPPLVVSAAGAVGSL
jgi:hypothetical protein